LSLIMFVLFRIKDVPEMGPLSRLVYLVGEEEFIKIIKYFGGQTVTFPTKEEFNRLTKTLLLYNNVELENGKLSEEIEKLGVDDSEKEKVLGLYKSVKEVMQNYEFV